jgi:hypothetical protein
MRLHLAQLRRKCTTVRKRNQGLAPNRVLWQSQQWKRQHQRWLRPLSPYLRRQLSQLLRPLPKPRQLQPQRRKCLSPWQRVAAVSSSPFSALPLSLGESLPFQAAVVLRALRFSESRFAALKGVSHQPRESIGAVADPVFLFWVKFSKAVRKPMGLENGIIAKAQCPARRPDKRA